MKTLPSAIFNSNLSKGVGGSVRHVRALCLTFFSVILIATSSSAAINHVPIVGWLPDQRAHRMVDSLVVR